MKSGKPPWMPRSHFEPEPGAQLADEPDRLAEDQETAGPPGILGLGYGGLPGTQHLSAVALPGGEP